MRAKIEITNCQDEKELIKHLLQILLKLNEWDGKKDSEGLSFTDKEDFGTRKVSIDSDIDIYRD